jgi:lysylphosphatidylglycerol synthetase-like protein (DUF2156 family)
MTPLRAKAAQWLRRVTCWLRRAPLTVAFVLVLWGIGASTGTLLTGPSPALMSAVGVGLPPLQAGHWWMLVTSLLWCPGLASYLVTTALLVTLLSAAERRLGTARTGALLLMVHLLGLLAGLGLVSAIALTGGRWATHISMSATVGPAGAVVGLALTASAALSVLWRRRVRLVMLIAIVMLALYSGLLSDVLRLATALVGLALGALAFGRGRRAGRGPSSAVDAVSRPSKLETRLLVALVVAAAALGPLIAAFAHSRVGPLWVLRYVVASPPPDAQTVQQICAEPSTGRECAHLLARVRLSGIGPGIISVMPVLLLLATAEGLRRGRHAAWIGALTLNLALGGLGVLLAVTTAATPVRERIMLGPGHHLHTWLIFALPVLQPFIVSALLLRTRHRFRVRAPIGTYRRWATIATATLLAVSGCYAGGSLLLAGDYDRPPGFPELLRDLPTRFLPPDYLGQIPPTFLPTRPVVTILYEWTGAVFWGVVAVTALITFTRTRLLREDSAPARARKLLAATGGSSLAHMATWRGQSYWFTPDGSAAFAYRVIAGVAVTTGEPIGAPGNLDDTLHGFAEHCHRHGWTPCLYGVGAEVATTSRALGWGAVQVGEELLLPLPQLRLSGKKWQDVRTALNHARKAGLAAEWCRYSNASPTITDQIRTVSEEWLDHKGLPELEFTLGGVNELADDEVRLLIAIDRHQVVQAVTSWLPMRRDGNVIGWTLDFMRRRTDAPPGIMEFLIASAALQYQAEGAELLSLSGSPLARMDRGEPINGLQRVLDLIGRKFEPIYGFRSLLAFKAKFQPIYRPLYLAYPDPAALLSIGNAIARAYLPHLTSRQATHLARLLVTASRSEPKARAFP